MLNRHSNAWTSLSVIFCFGYLLDNVSGFCPGWSQTVIPHLYLPLNRDHRTVTLYLAYWLRWDLANVCLGKLPTSIFSIHDWVAEITGVSHHVWPRINLLHLTFKQYCFYSLELVKNTLYTCMELPQWNPLESLMYTNSKYDKII
jgi:hypothetical protein